MIPTLYRGSVKDVLGPVTVSGPRGDTSGVVLEYTDSYSVFDWGRMPDALTRKGEALAILAADWFERLESAENWKAFSKTPEALSLRKGNRFGAVFNEIGEKLQNEGLRTHFLGAVSADQVKAGQSAFSTTELKSMAQLEKPSRHWIAKQVSVVKPQVCQVLGRAIPDYLKTRVSPVPRLIPLEVVFRFSCPEGSSLLERVEKDPQYLAARGFGDWKVAPGIKWDFPVLEMFTKLETADRPLTLGESLAISGVSGTVLQEMLLKTAWIAGFFRASCSRLGLELADGKLEWGVSDQGECFLVDAVGPDELRILKGGIQLSKEFLRNYYRNTPWYESVVRAKTQATALGVSEWKRGVPLGPQSLPASHRELASQVYLALTNALTGKNWFPEAWSLDRVVSALETLEKGTFK